MIIFGCFPPPAPNRRWPLARINFRYMTRRVLENGWWNQLLLASILVSCLVLALESPVEEQTLVQPETMDKIDVALFSVFLTEFIIKIFNHGIFWEHPLAYFRQSWNCLDFFILSCTVLDFLVSRLFAPGNSPPVLGAVKVLRVLRPLRLINKVPSLQFLLNALIASRQDLLNVLLLWGFTFLLFAIFGVALFSGTFIKCNDMAAGTRPLYLSVPCPAETEPPASWYTSPADTNSFMCDPSTGRRLAPPIFLRQQCSGSMLTSSLSKLDDSQHTTLVFKGDGTEILAPRVWSKLPSHFDNVAAALQAQVLLISRDNWSEMAFAATDITGIGLQPLHNASPFSFLFFVLFLLLSVFFILQLLIAVFIDAVRAQSGNSMNTEFQVL